MHNQTQYNGSGDESADMLSWAYALTDADRNRNDGRLMTVDLHTRTAHRRTWTGEATAENYD